MSIVGNDEAGGKLRQLFDEKGINADLVFTVEDRPTTEKIRLLAKSNNQQVLRLDVENTDPFETYYDALDGSVIKWFF